MLLPADWTPFCAICSHAVLVHLRLKCMLLTVYCLFPHQQIIMHILYIILYFIVSIVSCFCLIWWCAIVILLCCHRAMRIKSMFNVNQQKKGDSCTLINLFLSKSYRYIFVHIFSSSTLKTVIIENLKYFLSYIHYYRWFTLTKPWGALYWLSSPKSLAIDVLTPSGLKHTWSSWQL